MAEKVVVDTSVVIEIFEEGNEDLLFKIASYDAYISYISLYEYLWGYRYIGRDYIDEKKVLERLFKVIYPTQEILLKAIEIDVDLTKKGEKLPQADIFIGSTAIVLKAQLITRDVKHFSKMEKYGLKIATDI